MVCVCVVCRPVMCDGAVYRLDVAPPHHGSTSLVNLATLCTSDSERYIYCLHTTVFIQYSIYSIIQHLGVLKGNMAVM